MGVSEVTSSIVRRLFSTETNYLSAKGSTTVVTHPTALR